MPLINPSATAVCEGCGRAIPTGEERCPHCDHDLLSSGRLDTGCFLPAADRGFRVNPILVNYHRRTELDWRTPGLSGRPRHEIGVSGHCGRRLPHITLVRPGKYQSRLRLAEALLAEDHYQEARSHLLSLWEEDPANGEVNLALARLNVKLGNKKAAVRYFRNAINGVWDSSPREQRIAPRFELVRYLMQQHDTNRRRRVDRATGRSAGGAGNRSQTGPGTTASGDWRVRACSRCL